MKNSLIQWRHGYQSNNRASSNPMVLRHRELLRRLLPRSINIETFRLNRLSIPMERCHRDTLPRVSFPQMQVQRNFQIVGYRKKNRKFAIHSKPKVKKEFHRHPNDSATHPHDNS